MNHPERKASNEALITVIKEMIQLHPDLRFNQILINLGVYEPNTDPYHEESDVTLQRVMDEMQK